MKNMLVWLPVMVALIGLTVTTVGKGPEKKPRVVMQTSLGNITLELFPDKAPITVGNFLRYVDDGFFEGTVFHRVIPNFMIQGGGMSPDLSQKETLPSITNEAANGLSNSKGTIAMARTAVVDSATSQFFINLVDNAFLDHRGKNPRDFGYCVFGQVTEGMDVVEKIGAAATGRVGPYQDVPLEAIIIEKVTRVEE